MQFLRKVFNLINPMEPPFRIGSFYNIPIFISRWLTLMLFGFYCLNTMRFLYLGMGPEAMLQGAIYPAFMCAIYFFVLVHEYGHALTAESYGIRCPRILLWPFGGIATISELRHDQPSKEFWITINGPMTNMAWYILFTFAAQFFPAGTGVNYWLLNFAYVNKFLFWFNMIPVCPMDGGRIFRALLQIVGKVEPLKAAKITYYTGLVVGFGGAFIFFWNGMTFAAVLLCMMASQSGREWQTAQIRHQQRMYANRGGDPNRYEEGDVKLFERTGNALDDADALIKRNQKHLRR